MNEDDQISKAHDAALRKGRWVTIQRVQSLRYWQAERKELTDLDLRSLMSDQQNHVVIDSITHWEGTTKPFSPLEEAVISGDLGAAFRLLLNQYGHERLAEYRAKLKAPPGVGETKKALSKTFDRTQTLDALNGLRKHLEVKRRTYERGSLDYREMTTEVERVRDLITLLELDPKDSGL